MNRIIVTGGAGFIGSHLVDALIARRHLVTIVDDLSTGRRQNVPPGVELVQADIRSPRMKDVFRDFRPQYVFHLAAQKNVRTSIEDPVFDADVNISGSLNIIEQCRRFGVKKIIFSSTGGALYGDGVKLPTPEKTPPKPESPYGIAKYTIEQYLRFYRANFGLRSVSLRYANVYGPRQDPAGEAGVVAIFAQQLQAGLPLAINGDGKQTRDYVYVSDVVNANLLALRSAVQGEINIGTGAQTSVNKIAKLMIIASGKNSRLVHRRGIPGEVKRSALDAKLAQRYMKWRPEVKLLAGIQMTWASMNLP